MAPALSALCVLGCKFLAAKLHDYQITEAKAIDILTWALASFIASCCWRIFTDRRTVIGRDVANDSLLLLFERIACIVIALFAMGVCFARPEDCVKAGFVRVVVSVYTTAVVYGLLGPYYCSRS